MSPRRSLAKRKGECAPRTLGMGGERKSEPHLLRVPIVEADDPVSIAALEAVAGFVGWMRNGRASIEGQN